MQMKKFLFSSLVFSALFSASAAYADISALILDSEGMADHITNGGHSVLVLSDICAETPTKLRLCTEDDQEKGVVINKMQTLSAEKYNWIATPFEEFLYGASSKQNAPLIANKKIVDADIQRRYDEYYSQSIHDSADKGRWTKSVGALFLRTVYEYRLPGFLDDEVSIMNALNNGPNKSDYNVILKNCADFVEKNLRPVLNTSIALSVDGGGIHSPKAIAMNLTRLGIKEPDLHMQVIKYPQISGTFTRSTSVMAPSENLYKNPLFAVPIGIFVPEIPFVAFALNEIFLRFHQESAYEKSLTPEQRAAILGTPEEWKSYKNEFHDLVAKAKSDLSLPQEIHDVLAKAKNDKDVPKKLMAYFSSHGTFTTKEDSVEMSLPIAGEAQPRLVGMTRETVMKGDHQIGYIVMLADLGQTIYDRVRVRSSMEDFKDDWMRMQALGNDSPRNPASLELSADVYDKMFPFYTTQCAVNQMVKKNGEPPGGEYGHSLLYIKGACRDTSASYPKLKMCEPGDGQPTGAIVSLDSIYLNTKFIVMDGKELMFNAGLGKDQPLTQDYFDQIVAKALKTGAAKGVTLTDGTTDEESVIRRSTQTDWALSFAHDAACVRIPMNQKQIQAMVDTLNTTNEPYVNGKKQFHWNEISDNCVTLIRETFSKIGLRAPIGTPHGLFKQIEELKQATKSELPIPAMDLVQTIDAVNNIKQVGTAEAVFANAELRDYFNKFGTLPGATGGTIFFVPMHEVGNDLYTHGANLIFDKLSKGANEKKWESYLEDASYSSIDGNLNIVLNQFFKIQTLRKAVDESTELGKFAKSYNAWIDQSIKDIQLALSKLTYVQVSP
jgi:hypothetical protein